MNKKSDLVMRKLQYVIKLNKSSYQHQRMLSDAISVVVDNYIGMNK